MAPKRKVDPKQPSLEETVGKPVTKVKTKGTKKEVKEEGDHNDLVRARLARKHGNGNFFRGEALSAARSALPGLTHCPHVAADPAFQKKEKKTASKAKLETSEREVDEDKPNFVDINRAPVLTLWVRTWDLKTIHCHL